MIRKKRKHQDSSEEEAKESEEIISAQKSLWTEDDPPNRHPSGLEVELQSREVHCVVFRWDTNEDWHCDAAESAMLLKSVLAPTHSKAPFNVCIVEEDNAIYGKAWFANGGAAVRAQTLHGVSLRADISRATATIKTMTLEMAAKEIYFECRTEAKYASAATTLRESDCSDVLLVGEFLAGELSETTNCTGADNEDNGENIESGVDESEWGVDAEDGAPHACYFARKESDTNGDVPRHSHHSRFFSVVLDNNDGEVGTGERFEIRRRRVRRRRLKITFRDDEALASIQALWWMLSHRVLEDNVDVGKLRDKMAASATALKAMNAGTQKAMSGIWDAPSPPKFDAKLERWTLTESASLSSTVSPPTFVAETRDRCAWTTTTTVPRSVFAKLHKRRVAERSPRVEHVLETVVDPSGARWTLSLDARRPENRLRKDDASDVGVYARCDFAGPDGARPFGACCEARFAFCVAERLSAERLVGNDPLLGCGGSRAASWLFRGRELYDDQSVPHLPARGFARLVVGLRATSRGWHQQEPTNRPTTIKTSEEDVCVVNEDGARGLWFSSSKCHLLSVLGHDRLHYDCHGYKRSTPNQNENNRIDHATDTLPKDKHPRSEASTGDGDCLDGNSVRDGDTITTMDHEPGFDEDVELIVCASVLSLRRSKGVDTWRLVRRCCAEGASGYSRTTLRPQNLWAFLCRAVRSGDVECVKAIARQIQAENSNDTTTGILRQLATATTKEHHEDHESTNVSSERSNNFLSSSPHHNNYSALHWLGNCDDANFAKAPHFAPQYAQIVAWFRSVCGTDVFEAEVDGGVDAHGLQRAATTPIGFIAGSTSDKTKASSKLAIAALLKAGADPTLPASREARCACFNAECAGSVSSERGTYAVARALYADNSDIAREILSALFAVGAYARQARSHRRQAGFLVVADAVDVLLSKADELVVAPGLQVLLDFPSDDAREATLVALRKRHADAIGRDADRSPVHELVSCALRMDSNPTAKQRKKGPRILKLCVDRTLALAARLVKEERLALRHARGGERVRLYLEAFTRRQARLLTMPKSPVASYSPSESAIETGSSTQRAFPNGNCNDEDDETSVASEEIPGAKSKGGGKKPRKKKVRDKKASSKSKNKVAVPALEEELSIGDVGNDHKNDSAGSVSPTALVASKGAKSSLDNETIDSVDDENNDNANANRIAEDDDNITMTLAMVANADASPMTEDAEVDDGDDVIATTSGLLSKYTTHSISEYDNFDNANDKSDDDAAQPRMTTPAVTAKDARSERMIRAAVRLRELVEHPYALTGESVEELARCRDLTRGLEGSARDRAAARRLIRKHRGMPPSASPDDSCPVGSSQSECECGKPKAEAPPGFSPRRVDIEIANITDGCAAASNKESPGDIDNRIYTTARIDSKSGQVLDVTTDHLSVTSPAYSLPHAPDNRHFCASPNRSNARLVSPDNDAVNIIARSSPPRTCQDAGLIAVYWSWPRVWL